MNIPPLAALFAIVIVGITVEAVERQSKQAAYALVILILLGIITFNAQLFSRQVAALLAVVNRPGKPGAGAGGARPKGQPIQGR